MKIDRTRAPKRKELPSRGCWTTMKKNQPTKSPLLTTCIICVIIGISSLFPWAQQSEEPVDYYKKWVEQHVKYIIIDQEKKSFEKLRTDDERESFIEQFWRRRDPDPRTAINEYREEHFRRIAYANENFKSGVAGWRTDRGRIYIMHGPPTSKKTHQGGHYRREPWEGGGFTAAFPFEVWRYDYLEGIGGEIEIEFVDPTMTGEFRLARNPDEKDALMHVGGVGGMTMAELSGSMDRGDRIRNQIVADPIQPMYGTLRMQDLPFQRMQRLFQLSRPAEIKFKDLQRVVSSKVYFDHIPVESAVHHIRLTEKEMLVPITVRIEDRHLQFKEHSGAHKATVDIYGAVTSLQGRIVYEFDDTVSTFLPNLDDLARQHSVYQKKIGLEPGLYKVELVVRDANNEQMGMARQRISLGRQNSERLITSAVFLARRIESVEDPELVAEPFVMGPFKVVPRVDRRYHSGEPLLVYFEVYNFGLDASTGEPDLKIDYQIRQRAGKSPAASQRTAFSTFRLRDRVIAINALQLENLGPGEYKLEITISDEILDHSATCSTTFQLAGLETDLARTP